MSNIKEMDAVVLTRDLPKRGMKRGGVGRPPWSTAMERRLKLSSSVPTSNGYTIVLPTLEPY